MEMMMRRRLSLFSCFLCVLATRCFGLSAQHETKSLYVVGCGVLGTAVAREWLSRRPDAEVVAETLTTRRHEELESFGCRAVLRDERGDGTYDAVLIASPPSAYADGDEYAREVEAAAKLCKGSFLMTSSGGVFLEDDGGICVETSPVTDSPRALKLLAAEKAALRYGAVLRLAGLYNLNRGAHVVWLQKERVDAVAESLVNLVHYDDAAIAAVNALEGRLEKGKLYLAADMHPRSRQAIADAAQQHPKFCDMSRVTFTGSPQNSRGPKGKGRVYDCSYTMETLDWHPRYPTIEDYFSSQQDDEEL